MLQEARMPQEARMLRAIGTELRNPAADAV
jgi:hypothetical protein